MAHPTVFFRHVFLLVVCFALLAGCTKSSKETEAEIPVPVPAKSLFGKVQLHATRAETLKAIGKPLESNSYESKKTTLGVMTRTEKRILDLYQGVGRIIYTGENKDADDALTVLKIIYDPNESGRFDKQKYPDGPQYDRMKKRATPKKVTRKSDTSATSDHTPPPAPSTPPPAQADPLGGL